MHPSPSRSVPVPQFALLPLLLLFIVGGASAVEAPVEIGAIGTPSTGTIVREGDILERSATALQRRGVGGSTGELWPDGIVPVWIDPDVPPASRKSVRRAIARWNEVAGIRIEELAAFPGSHVDHVLFEPGDGCASWVGRRGGAQSLWVAPACNVGSMMHELGHAIGLEHEHTRPDRDNWIQVRWDNVLPGKRHNFDRAPDDAPMLGEYDYASIMHYGPDFFSADGGATIEPLLDPAVRIGQRSAPSAGDIDAIAELYGTDLAVSADLFVAARSATEARADDRPTHDLDLFVSNGGTNGAHDVLVTVGLLGDWRSIGRHDTVDDWHCDMLVTSIACRLKRLSAGQSARLSLALHSESVLKASRPTADEPTTAKQPAGLAMSPLNVRVAAGSDDGDVSNDVIIVQRVSKDGRAPGASIALADDSGSGDLRGRVVTGGGSFGLLSWLCCGLVFACRRRCSRYHRDVTGSPVAGSMSGS